MNFEGANRQPGISTTLNLVETQLWWGKEELTYLLGNRRISGAARDAGNTSYTTILRAGLILGEITSGKILTNWDPTATDGSQHPIGFLTRDLATQENGANSNSLVGRVMYAGYLKASQIIIPGETAAGLSGKDLEFVVRNAFASRVLWDDNLDAGNQKQFTIAASATIGTNYHKSIIDNNGAAGSVTITLPAPKRGLEFTFILVTGQNIVLASTATGQFVPSSGTPADTITLASTKFQITRVIGTGSTYKVIRIIDTP